MEDKMRTAILLFLAFSACRPDPGTPDYPTPTPFGGGNGGGSALPGDVPWDGQTPRLSLSVFYEGDSSDLVLVDDVENFFYVYEGSFSSQISDDRVEGLVSDVLTVSVNSWWGGGIHVAEPGIDMSQWNTLHVAMRSSDAEMETFAVGMVGSAGEGRAVIGDYGFVADGEWHVLNIPLADIQGAVGLDAVTVPLLLISAAGTTGSQIQIDDLYFTTTTVGE